MIKKTGLFGGTFNPIHNGHLELGKKVLQNFKLDNIFYILSARPPHKSLSNLAPVKLRWEMLKSCLEPHQEEFSPINIEMQYNTPSWTIDTVLRLKIKYPQSNFCFISGSEGFLKIRTWKKYQKLLKELPFIIILRDNKHLKDIQQIADETDLNVYHNNSLIPFDTGIYLFNYQSSTLDISSTMIRDLKRNKKDISPFLSQTILKYIKENNLYEV